MIPPKVSCTLIVLRQWLWLALAVATCSAAAQDIHFSQFNFSPLYQNPANTDLFHGDYRFAANYKNQWSSVSVRFHTFSASAEMNFATLKNEDRIGGGLLFFVDRAGDSRFTSLNTALSFSYILTLGKNAQHTIAYGVQLGIGNRSFSYAQLNFDNQWNGDSFDPNIAIDENFGNTKINFFDLGAGIAYRWEQSERTHVTVGFSAAHLNAPNQSFYGDKAVKLNPRFTIHAGAQVRLSERVDLVPGFMFQRQDVKQEFLLGTHVKYHLPVKIPHSVALNLGAYGRIIDAGWLLAGVDFDNLQVNLSYDVNFTKLKAASRYNGGFELSAIYILAKVKKISKPACPAFL